MPGRNNSQLHFTRESVVLSQGTDEQEAVPIRKDTGGFAVFSLFSRKRGHWEIKHSGRPRTSRYRTTELQTVKGNGGGTYGFDPQAWIWGRVLRDALSGACRNTFT